MKCLQVCMASAHHTLNRNLMFVREVNLKTGNKVNVGRIEVKNYRHRTWTHLCWSYSSLTRESKYYQDGVIFGVDQFNGVSPCCTCSVCLCYGLFLFCC